METKYILVPFAAAFGLFMVAWLFASMIGVPSPGHAITNFDECAAAGNSIMESYPRQCSANGQTFVEEISSGMPVPGAVVFNSCAVAGCSGQLCVSAVEAENIMTTCEHRPEYICYRDASCEPQQNGECGWTETLELKQCLTNPPPEEPIDVEMI
ncbi:MAG: hypothetical protein G01um10148_1077 [Parcubacteria group bacterium Gr01-1014_8]|nr:MAG: hypothetical protein G01um10148_1077 [Parcubacteria group bacterium Gr01-1014_8]